MKGAFAVNQWLIDEGLLKVRNSLSAGKMIKFEELDVDWSKTVAWAWGGYYSRVFLNVKGREPNRVIRLSEYDKVRDEIAEMIKSIKGPNGEKWDNKVFYPEEIYPVAKGDKPDIMVYFNDLYWRAADTLGQPSNYLPENDTDPDDAVHSEYGVFALHLPEMYESIVVDTTIYDFAPTILKLFGMDDIAASLRGVSLI